MPWTKPQIRAAAIAARNAGWNEQQRGMALSSLGMVESIISAAAKRGGHCRIAIIDMTLEVETEES